MLERFYTVPYVVLTNRDQWRQNTSEDNSNAFIQDAIVITTYDFAADNEEAAKVVNWDLTVFEEANALSPVYREDNKQAKALKRIAGDSFKLLLTGTPIEKNIMDLYGLIWFIDETLLPGEKEFLARYLRRPENYPELSEQVSRYCFRTLRSQAKHYAKVTERVLLTVEYTPGKAERQLYELLYAYINQPGQRTFPGVTGQKNCGSTPRTSRTKSTWLCGCWACWVPLRRQFCKPSKVSSSGSRGWKTQRTN